MESSPRSSLASVYRSGGGDGDRLANWRRLLFLHQRLGDGSAPSAGVLAAECGVSRKTIYRDLAALRDELGAPIVYDANRRGSCYDGAFELPMAMLSDQDLFTLLIAEQAVAQYQGTPLREQMEAALDKLLAFLPGPVRSAHERIARHVRFGGMPAPRVEPEVWQNLAVAIEKCQVIELGYRRGGTGIVDERVVHPMELVARDRDWFLVAHRPDKDRSPIYYVPRILTVRPTGATFDPAEIEDGRGSLEGDFNAVRGAGKPRTIRLRFPSVHLAEERPWAATQKIVRHRDGAATLTFRSTALFEIERQVLRYGGQVVVVGPQELRASIARTARRLLDRHGPDGPQ